MTGISFDGIEYFGFGPHKEAEFIDGGVYTIFDTATSDIWISDIWYDSLRKTLIEHMDAQRTGFGGYWDTYVFYN